MGFYMYRLLIPLIAVGLSACGGGTTTDPNNFIISTPTGTPLTATQAKSFGQPSAGAPFSPNNSFTDTIGGTTATLFLNENTPNASIANIRLKTGSNTEELFGIVGSLTPVATLTSLASASYSGLGEISIDRANGLFDDAPNSVATLSANFTSGSLNGSIAVADNTTGDNGGAFDIVGGTVGLSGTISGNSFTLTPDYSGMTVSGVTNINAQPINGGFYGTNAENAVGVGLSLGQSNVANDVVIYTRIQANKQ